MARPPSYSASKVGLNGLKAHKQVSENDRVGQEWIDGAEEKTRRIMLLVVGPRALKTTFTGFHDMGKDPKVGAEAVVRLIGNEDDKHVFDQSMCRFNRTR